MTKLSDKEKREIQVTNIRSKKKGHYNRSYGH